MKKLGIFLGVLAFSASATASEDPFHEAVKSYNSKAMKLLVIEDLRDTDNVIQELIKDLKAKSNLLPMPLFTDAYEVSLEYPEYLKFVGAVLNHDIKGLILNSFELGLDSESGCTREIDNQQEDNQYTVTISCPVYNYGNVKWLKPTDVVTDKYSFVSFENGFVLEDIELGVVEHFNSKAQSLIKELQTYDETKA
ncbi:conserved exported hypothetical protein [Vibrio chagasii]|nr:conserved exported hypothetical protein [Vibrio chagasii]